MFLRVLAVCFLSLVAAAPHGFAQSGPSLEKTYALRPGEGVFAYSRISPDGRYLAYTSETGEPGGFGDGQQTVTVVELSTGQVLFREAGIDGYWSTGGDALIFSSHQADDVSLWRRTEGYIARDVAPADLGDYYSWAEAGGRPLILTILGWSYRLEGDKAVLPAVQMPACPDIGMGERPLISKDGKQATVFVAGSVVVRNLSDCERVIDTGMAGAKADFSFDGRYIAFHGPKADGPGSQIEVVDLQRRTVRTITAGLSGSSAFPSWTRDGRLSFHYEGEDYRGFMMASDVLAAPERPLPAKAPPLAGNWQGVFPETPLPAQDYALVMIWGSWSAHTPQALADLQRARDDFAARGLDIAVLTAAEPATQPDHIARIRARAGAALPEIPLAPKGFAATEARNQIPATLLFKDGQLIGRRLGPQSYEDLETWIRRAP